MCDNIISIEAAIPRSRCGDTRHIKVPVPMLYSHASIGVGSEFKSRVRGMNARSHLLDRVRRFLLGTVAADVPVTSGRGYTTVLKMRLFLTQYGLLVLNGNGSPSLLSVVVVGAL